MLAMVLATVFTWGTGMIDFGYDEGQVIGFADGFPGAAATWQTGGDPGSVTVSAGQVRIARTGDQRAYAARRFALPPGLAQDGSLLRVSGRVTTLRKAGPQEPENIAALMLWFLDSAQQPFDYLTVRSLHGTEPCYEGARVVDVPDDAHHLVIAMLTRDSDGHFALTEASARQIATTSRFELVQGILLGSWGLLLLTAGYWVLWRIRWWTAALLLTLLAATFVGVLLPESATTGVLQPLYRRAAAVVSVSSDRPLAVLFKLGHFGFFLAVTLVLLIVRSGIELRTITILQFMVLLALATEGLQLHLFNRTTRLSDIGIDLLGIALAWALVFGIQRWRSARAVH